MKLIALIAFVTSAVSEIEEEFEEFGSTFDADLQEIRWDLMRVEGTAKQLLDAYFFEAYNEMMNRFYTPYEELKVEWQSECKEFPREGLDGFVARSFNNLCDNVEYFQSRQLNMTRNYLRSIYNGGILTESLMESNVENFFQNAVERLEFIILMYHFNQSCVRPKLPKLVQIYQNFVEEFSLIAKTFKMMAPRSQKEYQFVVDDNLRLLHKYLDEISACKTALNVSECLLPIIDLRQCPLICGAEYKILRTSRKVHKTFNRNKSIHSTLINARLVKILRLNAVFSDVLINWENEVEECLVARDN